MALIPNNPYATPDEQENGRVNQMMLQGQINPYQRPNKVQDLSAVATAPAELGPIDMPKGAGEGWAKGFLARKELERQTNADRRAEETLNLTKEEFGQKRFLFEKEMSLQNGMANAAQLGGYNGVISYLEQQDPERAIDFTKRKLALDESIMNNEVLRATSKKDIASAMAESYGIIGKMGASIFMAPPDQQEAMYSKLLPILRTVDPNAPDNLAEGTPNLMLGMAQSMPANAFWANKTTAQQAQSAAGKLQSDIDNRVARGETPENSEGLRNLLGQMSSLTNKAQKAQWDADKYEMDKDLQRKISTQTLVNGIQDRYTRDSKPFQEFMSSSTGIKNSLQVYLADPNNADAAASVKYHYAKMNAGGGVLSDTDLVKAVGENTALSQAMLDLQNIGLGQKKVFTETQIGNIKAVLDLMDKTMMNKQGKVNSHYTQVLDSNGLPRGSLSFAQSAPPAAIDALMNNPTPQMQDDFYKKYGYMPYLGARGDQ